MTNQAISQLTAGTPPYAGTTLLELSIAGPASVSGKLSDILASGTVINPFIINFDSNTPVVAGTSVVMLGCPWTSLTVVSLSAVCTGGSFMAEFEIGGTAITGLSAVSVSSTAATTNATGANTMTLASNPLTQVTMIISAVTGTPTTACLQLNLSVTA